MGQGEFEQTFPPILYVRTDLLFYDMPFWKLRSLQDVQTSRLYANILIYSPSNIIIMAI